LSHITFRHINVTMYLHCLSFCCTLGRQFISFLLSIACLPLSNLIYRIPPPPSQLIHEAVVAALGYFADWYWHSVYIYRTLCTHSSSPFPLPAHDPPPPPSPFLSFTSPSSNATLQLMHIFNNLHGETYHYPAYIPPHPSTVTIPVAHFPRYQLIPRPLFTQSKGFL
jgi:hypothetical protein